MEVIGNIEKYRASLVTYSKCVLIVMRTYHYLQFLQTSTDYLFKRTRLIINRELDEHLNLRTFLMIKSVDRLKLFFIDYINHNGFISDVCEIKITRKQIMEDIGYSVKTVNRSMKKLQSEGYLKTVGQKILISRSQYEMMKDSIDSL